MTQDRPDAHELLAAVAQYLIEDLLPHVAPEQRFGVRIAANSCAIAAREAAQHVPDREAQRALARAIRAGEHDQRWGETVTAVREEVRAKLAVNHPGWDAVADDGRG
jgi:Domain of unknown function (DUF6285)